MDGHEDAEEEARLGSLEARLQELEQTVVELDDTAQAFKLLAEKQAAEINAKELLLTRKSEYVEELLEQLRALGEKLESKQTETQTLELKAQKLETQVTELREQVHKDEEDFAMVCAALDAREQTLVKKNADLSTAVETEKQLRKELERHQLTIRRLEKSVEELQPEKADACLSPRSFHENQLIRLRDDAIEAKTREVWLLSGQNDQLRVQLDELETALEQLQRNVITKENDLVRRQRKIDRLEAEIDALQVSRSQAEGREKAMEIATTQNAKLLQALEAQERTADELKTRLDDCERECEQLRSSHRDHIARSAESEVEVLHRTRQAEEKASAVNALQDKLRRERKQLQDELSTSHLNYQMEIEKVQSELVMRRNKQYELTLRLQEVEAKLHEATDRRESAEEQSLAAQCRMQELERVLHESLEWKKQLEAELASQKEGAAAAAEKQNKQLADSKREVAALHKQLDEMKETLSKKLAQEKQQELRHRETKQHLSVQEALADEQKERIHRLVRDVNREAQRRAEVELERTTLKGQLEALRQQSEAILREGTEQKQQLQDRKERLAESFAQLSTEFHAVQSAKSKLLHKFADAFVRAASSSLATGSAWPTSDCLELRECWLVDDDLKPLVKMLEGEGSGRLRRIDLRYNRLTSDGMGRLVFFLKKLLLSTATTTSGIQEVDLRQNCISLDGIRTVASGLETLMTGRGSSNAGSTLKTVAVSDAGRIECFTHSAPTAFSNAGQDTSDFQVPVLVVDISANVDDDWMVAESRRFQAQRRRGKEPSSCDPSMQSSNNKGAAQLVNDTLSSRDKSLQEIYGFDLVGAFMGQDKVVPGKGRRRSTSNDNPARLSSPRVDLVTTSRKRVESASPRNGSAVGGPTDQLPLVLNNTRDASPSARMATSLSLPRLAG